MHLHHHTYYSPLPMRRSFHTLLALAAFLAVALPAQAQRYLAEITTNVSYQSRIKYGENDTFPDNAGPKELFFDLYQPSGDTVADRACIVLIPAGSYLSLEGAYGFIQNRGDSTRPPNFTIEDYWVSVAATYFARRGYVVAVMEHRRGWSPFPTQQDSALPQRSIIQAVFRAQQDLRGMIRHLKANAGTYGIDTGKIAAGGSNSGGYTAINGDVIDPSEITLPKLTDPNNGQPFIDTVALGGFEGNTNQLGTSSNFHCVINLGGAVADTSLVQAGDLPVVAVHGYDDDQTPYGTAIVRAAGVIPIIEVSGGFHHTLRNHNLGNQGVLVAFNDSANTPENPDSLIHLPGMRTLVGARFEAYNWSPLSSSQERDNAISILDTVLGFLTPRVYAVLFNDTTTTVTAYSHTYGQVGTDYIISSRHQPLDPATQAAISVYPNPASGAFNLNVGPLKLNKLDVIDQQGRLARRFMPSPSGQYDLNGLPAGLYHLAVFTDQGYTTTKLLVTE